MRIRSTRDLRKQKLGLVVILLVPVILLGTVAGVISKLYTEIPSFGMDESKMPDISTFRVANYSRLAEMARFFDQRYEDYHMPLNYTVSTTFTDLTYGTVDEYHFSDNAALYSANAMAAFVGKYLAAKRENNGTLKNESLDVIRKLTHGMSMLLAVPNGGLGSDHGSILARMWAAPEHRTVPGMPLFDDNLTDGPRPYAYYNGTGIYSQYRYSDFTSLDEHGGYYMGIAMAYKFVDEADAPWVHDTLELVIDQLCNGLKVTNYLGLGGYGGPTGTDQEMRFFQGGSWVLLLMKMGALAFPEKYERLYYHYAINEGYAFHTREGGPQEIVANYYAYNFGSDVAFALLMLEEDPYLHNIYLRNFHDGLWSFVKTHRNAHFNTFYLLVNEFNQGDNVYYERDVEDQLMEFEENHFPDVYGSIDPVGPEYELMDFSNWIDFFESNPIGSVLSPLFFEFDLDKDFYDRPLTVSMRRTRNYMWGGNPFHWQNTSAPTNLLHEQSGLSYLTPYWLMRGFG
ncbi:hypothetical protein GF325_03535, partial [Candidatus Bathyarchaeota archaeon]|nr:hypothetical protein [Candidatus Bathyarchaeota archaeon]